MLWLDYARALGWTVQPSAKTNAGAGGKDDVPYFTVQGEGRQREGCFFVPRFFALFSVKHFCFLTRNNWVNSMKRHNTGAVTAGIVVHSPSCGYSG